jgi:hypothetical protein
MAIKLGEIGITVCPCEEFTDTALNIQSRIDKTPDNLWLGFDWAKQRTPSGRSWCVRNKDGTWTCANPQDPSTDLAPVSDLAYRRMRAQINNDARGWETDVTTLGSEAEPYDPAEIKGNFTHEEFPRFGYALPIAVGMGNDYWGYVPEYREYRSHDHYRKALSGVGPHGADFLATRLARMAASLNGGPGVDRRPIDDVFVVESARAQTLATALGELGAAYGSVYEAALPSPGGSPRIATQPKGTHLFGAAHVSWVGGSTYDDVPDVRVQRRVKGRWIDHGDTSGDVQVMPDFPALEEMPEWLSGSFEWRWTASFEAFGSDVALPDLSGARRRATPTGTYRFVIRGPFAERDYTLTSAPFVVAPWGGITASGLRREAGGVSFTVGPRPGAKAFADVGSSTIGDIDVPDSYASPFEVISSERQERTGKQFYCRFCSFRAWADTSKVTRAVVTRQRGSVVTTHRAVRQGDRFYAAVDLRPGDVLRVSAGGVSDSYGNRNATASNRLVVLR